MPQWRGDDQPLVITRQSEHGPEGHMSSSLEFGCHIGTHIDAPLHFLEGAAGVGEMPLDDFGGSALVVDVKDRVLKQTVEGDEPGALGPEVLWGDPASKGSELPANEGLAGIDFVLFHTGWDQHWGTEKYYQHWPWLTTELARILASADLKGVGLDTPSLDCFGGKEAHELCAAAGMINIENLTNLGALPRVGAWFQAFPLKLASTEASPVRALAWVEPQ